MCKSPPLLNRTPQQRLGLVWITALILMTFLSSCASETNLLSTEDLKIRVATNPDPPVTGNGQLVIYVTKSNGQPIGDVKVSVSVTASGMKTGTQDGMAVRQADGIYAYNVKFHMESKYAIRLWVYRNGTVIAIQDSTITLR